MKRRIWWISFFHNKNATICNSLCRFSLVYTTCLHINTIILGSYFSIPSDLSFKIVICDYIKTRMKLCGRITVYVIPSHHQANAAPSPSRGI